MAIENKDGRRIILLRKELKLLFLRFESLGPATQHKGGNLEHLMESIHNSEPIVFDFTKLIEVAVIMNDREMLSEIFIWYGTIIEKYRRPDSYVGITNDGDYDYFRFIGHELMVTMVGFLLKEDSLEFLKELLDRPIPINYMQEEYGPGDVYFYNAAEWLCLLDNESQVKNKISIHASLLMERHTTGSLAEIMPMNYFTAADYFLYLYNKIGAPKDLTNRYTWKPWSIVYLKEPPLFLKRAVRINRALELAYFFGLSTVEELRSQIEEKTLKVRSFFVEVPYNCFYAHSALKILVLSESHLFVMLD